MSNLIRKTLRQIRPANRNSPAHRLIFVQIQPFSSSLASIDQTPNGHSFTVDYLLNSCGFPLEKAIKSSKRINFETPEKPDAVIAFLCNHGFTKPQALNVIRRVPQVILWNPEKTLMPKLEFFQSKGFSSTDVARMLSLTPNLLTRSLENHIIPSFKFVENLIGSEERALFAIKRFAAPLLVDSMTLYVEILREAGVPNTNIAYLLTGLTRALHASRERFTMIVEEVKGMGFNPMRVTFVIAVHVLGSMSKSAWEKKIGVYKMWGLSQDEILETFGKYPWFMTASEDKIMRIMDFLVNQMGLESSCVSKWPRLLSCSFGKRIVPRCLVFEALQAKGLIKKPNMVSKLLLYSEVRFVRMVVNLAKEEAPELLKLYEEKMALEDKSNMGMRCESTL